MPPKTAEIRRYGALPVLLWCSTLRRQQMYAHGGGEERRITTPPTNPAAHIVVTSTSSACTLAQADEVPSFVIYAIGGPRNIWEQIEQPA